MPLPWEAYDITKSDLLCRIFLYAGKICILMHNINMNSFIFLILLVDCTDGSQKSGVKVAELLNMDMKGKVILNLKFSSKPGWSLRTYKVMPTYRVKITILCLDFVCIV